MEPINVVSINKDACVTVYLDTESNMFCGIVYDADHFVKKIVDIDPLDVSFTQLCAMVISEFASVEMGDDYEDIYDNLEDAAADMKRNFGRFYMELKDGILSVDVQRMLNTQTGT